MQPTPRECPEATACQAGISSHANDPPPLPLLLQVPEPLRECHVAAASNAEGSALLLTALAEVLERDDELPELSSDALAAFTRTLNQQAGQAG